jgi:hypothetical protein
MEEVTNILPFILASMATVLTVAAFACSDGDYKDTKRFAFAAFCMWALVHYLN